MPGDTNGGGTATQVPVGQMSKRDVFTTIREFERQYIPDKELQQLEPFWARLASELGVDTPAGEDTG